MHPMEIQFQEERIFAKFTALVKFYHNCYLLPFLRIFFLKSIIMRYEALSAFDIIILVLLTFAKLLSGSRKLPVDFSQSVINDL